jgi:GTP-binding protein EngB required for normal cell division
MNDVPDNLLREACEDADRKGLVAESDRSPLKATPDLEKLRAYTHTKLALAGQLRLLRDIHKHRGSESRLKQCDELMAKLAEDRFTLAVLGQFKRGKSSLMNAIIGRELLPVGILPLTSAITSLRFGPRERLLLERGPPAVPFPEEMPVERLAEFVTEKGNPGNCKRVKTACVEAPLPFLRRGLEFVDTPGVGSAIGANTATTLRFLPECDAVIFVTSVDTPLTNVELEFLREIQEHVGKIFFVVNKTDLLSGHEQQEVLEFIANTLRSQMGSEEVRMFPLSSRAGLSAKANGDASAYEQSGLKDLEETLAAFLSNEKAAVFLAGVADKALRLLEQEFAEVALRQRARDIPEPVLSQKLEALQAQWREQAAVRGKLFERLREHLVAQTAAALTPELQSFLCSQTSRWLSRSERLLAHAKGQRCALMLKRCVRLVLRQLRRGAWFWLSGQKERLSLVAVDAAAHDHWQQLESNVSSIHRLAARVLGLRQSTNQPAEVLPPGRLDLKFEPPFLPDLRWETPVPWPLAVLPATLTRRWLKKNLAAECARLRQSCQDQVVAFAANSVSKAVDALVQEVENRAAEIASRVVAAITGKPLAALGLVQDGKPVLVDSEYGDSALHAVRARLLALRADALQFAAPTKKPVDGFSSERIEPRTPQLAEELPVPKLEQADLARDLQTRGCPVCEHLTAATFGFLSNWQSTLYADEQAQRAFAAELGFCPLHTWQLEAISSPVGASVGHARLVEEVSRLLSRAAQDPQSGRFPLQIVRNSGTCRVCQLLCQAESAYIQQLAAFVREPDARQAYARSQGTCLRHLGLLLTASTGEEIARFLLTEAARRFEEMAEDMQSFGMKTESLRRSLRNRDEEDAYLRAIIHLVGARGTCFPWNTNGEI